MIQRNQQILYKKEIHHTIVEFIPVRGHPLQKIIRLNDSSVMYLIDQFVPIVQIGDRLYEKPNEEYFYLKSSKKKRTYQAEI